MATQASETTLEGHLEGLNRIHRGKVRDIFAVDEQHLLLVATDRVSAFDVILPQRIADKGKVLTASRPSGSRRPAATSTTTWWRRT
jgi:phosphoribosylaminoimidazole-succinocarboxamide synthase